MFVAAIKRVDWHVARSARSREFDLRVGNEKIRQRVADRRAIGDVAREGSRPFDLRRAKNVQNPIELGNRIADVFLQRREGDIRANDDLLFFFANLIQPGDLLQ